MQFERAVSAAFSFGMALFFLYSFLFPQETSQWLINNGAPLIYTELASLSIVPLLGAVLGKRTGVKVHETGWANWVGILFYLCIALGLAVHFKNLYLFAYFLLSLLVKFLDFRSRKDVVEPVAEAVAAAAMLAASFVTVLALSWLMMMFGLAASSLSALSTNNPLPAYQMVAAFVGALSVSLTGFLYFSLTGAYQLSPPGHRIRRFWLRLGKL